MLDRTVSSIVRENFIYARALYYLGVNFFEVEEVSLMQVCEKSGINTSKLLRCFYEFENDSKSSFRELQEYPVELLLEYLRHCHQLFIKDKLPFVSFLVDNHSSAASQDLKIIFPVFAEDFIKHIYEEEDQLFQYIKSLAKIEAGIEKNPARIRIKYPDLCLKHIQQHHLEEDEMESMRDLIDSFIANDLHGDVIINELRAFDRELLFHAQIENEILFPKAIALETKVFQKIEGLSQSN